MYVCIYVCMCVYYVCMYVCYVCYVCMYVFTTALVKIVSLKSWCTELVKYHQKSTISNLQQDVMKLTKHRRTFRLPNNQM